MKKAFVICAAIYLTLNLPLFSQNKTVFHYPLNNGDLWEYWEAPKFIVYEQHKVIGDTTLPNGKLYKIIEIKGNLNSGLRFQRIEDGKIYQVARRFVPPDSLAHEEYLLYKLDVEVGDIWPYPPYGYDGFLADSGIVRVNEIGLMSFANRQWVKMILGSYTLPDFGVWFNDDVVLLDSIGVYEDSFEGGYYLLRGAIINGRKYGTITSVSGPKATLEVVPESIALLTTYPNPLISRANILFDLKLPAQIQVSIFDVLGRKIYEFPTENYGIGKHILHWDGTNQLTGRAVPSGLYFVFLTNHTNQQLVRKFMVLK